MASANEMLPSAAYLESAYDECENINQRSLGREGIYDFLPEGPKCKCCPYGYHVDVGFVQYAEDAKRGKYLRHLEQIQRYKKKLRQTMEVFYKQHGRYPPMLNPPDLIKGSEADSESYSGSAIGEEAPVVDEDTFTVYGTTELLSQISGGSSTKTRTKSNASSTGQRHIHETSPSFVCPVSPPDTRVASCVECSRAVVTDECSGCYVYCPQCMYLGQQREALRQVDTHVTETAECEQMVQITREQLTKIREQMANSLARLRELEALVKNQPVLEARLNVVLEEKQLLKMHVEERDSEIAELRSKYEETVTHISILESQRTQDEVDFRERIAVVEAQIPTPPRTRDVSVGGGDVREFYFIQPLLLRNYQTDFDFDIPESILSTLRSRWESEFRRLEAQRTPIMRSVGVLMTPSTNTVSVDAKPLVKHSDVWQSVDMDDEEWHSKELNFSGGTDVLSWFQEQTANSREQRTIIQALRKAYQFNHSEFKSLIIHLLAKNVRSQTTQTVPSLVNVGIMTEDAETCNQGVGEDSVNVEVRPQVTCYSVGVGARPALVSKMAYTDRLFRFDAATNTYPMATSDVGTSCEKLAPPLFNFAVQTEGVRLREKGVLTDKIDIIDRSRMHNRAINTEKLISLQAATNTEQASRMDRSMATEERRLYQTSVCTEPVRTSNKLISVDLSPPAEADHMNTVECSVTTQNVVSGKQESSLSVQERMKTETWEEVTYFDSEGKVLRTTGPDCGHSSRAIASESDTSEMSISAVRSSRSTSRASELTSKSNARSRSTGGDSSASHKSGNIEFGGGTVRHGESLPPIASEMSSRNSLQRFASGDGETSGSSSAISTTETSVSSGFARSRIPMSHMKEDSGSATSGHFEGSSGTSRSSRSEMRQLLFGSCSESSKFDAKSSELFIACQTFARWMNDSTTTTSKQMNDAEASIRQFWFRLVGSRTSRHDAVEPYLTAIRELGLSVLSKVVNMADETGNTGIHYAVSNCNWPLVQLLLRTCPMQLDRLNRAGYSALMLASLCNVTGDDQIAAAKQLVQSSRNVDLSSTSGAGQTALMLAASHGCLPMVEALLAAGANPNRQDKEGSSALMCASEHGHTEVVRALLARPETDCNLRDGEGCTALSIAMENNHRDISLLIYARENLGKSAPSKGKKLLPQRRHVHISDNTTTYKYK